MTGNWSSTFCPREDGCRRTFRSATIERRSIPSEIQLSFRVPPIAASVVLCLVLATGYAKDPELTSLSMQHFRDTAVVQQNPIDSTTTISTENGFVRHSGPMRMVWNDEYLKAVIDHKTSQKSFQVYAWTIYSGNWRSYESASYQTANGPKSVPLAKIGKGVANCAVGECTYTERVAFSVDEEVLRRLAAANAPDAAAVWTYTLSAKSGPEFRGELSRAEIAGLLAKVDDLINAPPAAKPSVADEVLKFDLGVAGMQVPATADQTNRAGILVTGVDRGSVAQKSGIIVGDILYEFGGHPIKTLADLHSAVAAGAANSGVAIRLFRGTDRVSVAVQF